MMREEESSMENHKPYQHHLSKRLFSHRIQRHLAHESVFSSATAWKFLDRPFRIVLIVDRQSQ